MVDSVDPPLLIEAERWFDARAYALAKIGEGVQVRSVSPVVAGGTKPDVELRWVGTDFSHGGTPQGRRLQERALGDKKWTYA